MMAARNVGYTQRQTCRQSVAGAGSAFESLLLKEGQKMTMTQLGRHDFEKLLEFRVTLRRFQRWSEDQARAAGLTHVQHQLLVAIKGHHGDRPPTVGDLAGYLLLRPHSAGELLDRAEAAGLV